MTFRIPKFLSNGNNWLERQQATILSAASIITISSILSTLTGLLRNRLMVTYFYDGTNNNSVLDAYMVSFRLPELIFQLLVIGALSAAFIPVFSKYEKQSKEQAFRMASSVLTITLLAFVFFSVIIFIFAKPLTQMMTGDTFTPEQIAMSVEMTRIMLFAQFFFAISNFLSGTIQAYKRFIIPALSPIAYNVGIILGIVVLSPYFGILGPTFGVILGAFLHFSLQIPLAIRLGFRYHPRIDLSHPGVKEIYSLMAPRTLALSITQIQPLATTFFATHLAGNSLTIINLAQLLMTFPIRIFGVPIAQAALPFLSHESNAGESERFKKLVIQSLNQISFFAMPASILLLILRVPIVRIAYGAKNFTWDATLTTGRVVAILALSVAAQAAVHILIRAFYSLHNTKYPLFVSFFSTLVFLFGSYIAVFMSDYGLLGLAIAVSLSAVVEMILLLILLNKIVSINSVADLWIPQAKMFTASFLMAVFLWLPFRILDELVFDTTRTVDLIGLTITVSTIGMLTYILFAYLLQIQELKIVTQIISVFGSWKKTLSRSTEVVETAGQSDESSV